MRYQIEIKYTRGPWMLEGEFASLRTTRKEANRIARELTEDGTKFRLRLIEWKAATIETIANK